MPNAPPEPARCPFCEVVLSNVPERDDFSTSEHIVARQLFGKPHPKNLSEVVVPGCQGCNRKFKHDEDYFRSVVSMTDAGLSEAGRQFHEGVGKRVYEKDKGLRKKMASTFGGYRMRSQTTGAVVKQGMTQTVDWARVDRVVEKWVQGLYFKLFGRRLPLTAKIQIAMLDISTFNDLHFDVVETGPTWTGTFESWYSCDDEDPTRTRWSFLVWDRFAIVAFTNDDVPIQSVPMDGDHRGVVVEHFPLHGGSAPAGGR